MVNSSYSRKKNIFFELKPKTTFFESKTAFLQAKTNFIKKKICYIKYPIVTEKSASFFEKNQYTFIVEKNTDKFTIKKLIEFLFCVKVIKVNTSLIALKKKRLGKYNGYTNSYKKAVVKLAKENTINLFPDI